MENQEQQRKLSQEEIEKVNELSKTFESVIPQGTEIMTVINAAAYIIARAISISDASDNEIQAVMGNMVHNILCSIPHLREQPKQAEQ